MPPATVIRSLLVFDDKHPLFSTYKVAKRIAIGIVGGTLMALGVVRRPRRSDLLITSWAGVRVAVGLDGDCVQRLRSSG